MLLFFIFNKFENIICVFLVLVILKTNSTALFYSRKSTFRKKLLIMAIVSQAIDLEPWRNNLPDESILHDLEYGLMAYEIQELVKYYRSKLRHEKIVDLINKLKQSTLSLVWAMIIEDASSLPNYNRKSWSIGNTTKKGRIDFFETNDISIKYLEEGMEIQENHNNLNSNVDDLVILSLGNGLIEKSRKLAGVVIKVNRNKLDIRLVPVHYKKWVGPFPDKKDMKPEWWRNLRDNSNNIVIKKNISFSRCEKVGFYDDKIKKKRSDFIKKHNTELKKRKDFWDKFIEPIMGDLLNVPNGQYLKHLIIVAWQSQSNDVWSGEKPTHIECKCMTSFQIHRIPIDWRLHTQMLRNMFEQKWCIIKDIVLNNI